MLSPTPQPNIGEDGLAGGLHWRFWLVVPLAGIGAGIGAGLLMKLLRAVQWLAYSQAGENFLDAVEHASPGHRVAVLVSAGVFVAAARWLIRRCTGSTTSDLVAAIWFEAGRLPFWRTVAVSVASMIEVGLGSSLGRESAPKQAGGAVASLLASRARLSPGHGRLLVALGAGAGMAAVYDVPFGGALFALEVLLGTLALPLIAPALVVSLVATATAWLFLPDQATYDIPRYPVSPSLIVWSVLLGPVMGLASVAYVRLICWVGRWKPSRLGRVALPLAVFALLGLLAVPVPGLLGNGKDVVDLAFAGQVAVPMFLALVVLKPVMTAACLGAGAPGGLFTPTLAFGAVFGALAGVAWTAVWPDVPLGAFALVGATAILAATTQGPVSAIALMIELTQRLDTLLVPVMLAVAGAVLTASQLEIRSVYSGRVMDGRAAAGDRPSISAAARYGELLQVLLNHPERPLDVVDRHGVSLGPVDAARARSPEPTDGPLETATAGDFVGPKG